MIISICNRIAKMHQYVEKIEGAGNRFLVLTGDEEDRRRFDRLISRLDSAVHVRIPVLETGHEVADAYAQAIGVRRGGEARTTRRCIDHCRCSGIRRLVVHDAHHVYYDPLSRMYPERSFVLIGSAVEIVILIGDAEIAAFPKNLPELGRRAHVVTISDVLHKIAGASL